MTPPEIREARLRLGLTQAEMALRMEILGRHGGAQISKIERGELEPPVRFVKLLKAYLEGYDQAER